MVRFNKDFSNYINRLTKNFNAKITRLEKKNYPNYLLPSRIYARTIKRDYRTGNRRDLLIKLREFQEFTKRGSEKAVSLPSGKSTKWELNIMKRRRTRIIRAVKRQIKEQSVGLDRFHYSEYLHVKSLQNLLKKLQKPFIDRESLSSFNVEYQKQYSQHRKNVFYDNYFTMLFKDADVINYNQKKLKQIRDYLSKFSPEELIKLVDTHPAIKNIIDYYQFRENNDDALSDTFDILYDNLNYVSHYL